MKVGLVGFPGSGKTTVYNALTGQRAETGYAGRGGRPNRAVVRVPDQRVERLAEIYRPKKLTFAEIMFVDMPAQPGAGPRSLDPQALAAMREVDALVQVVRGFPAEDGTAPDPAGELSDLAAELALGDLAPVERRLERLKKEKGRPGEAELLERLRAQLDRGQPLRELPLTDAELT